MKRKYGAALARETVAEQQMRERAAEMKDNRYNYGSQGRQGLAGARQAPRAGVQAAYMQVSREGA